jgi:hypothetical protein
MIIGMSETSLQNIALVYGSDQKKKKNNFFQKGSWLITET